MIHNSTGTRDRPLSKVADLASVSISGMYVYTVAKKKLTVLTVLTLQSGS